MRQRSLAPGFSKMKVTREVWVQECGQFNFCGAVSSVKCE